MTPGPASGQAVAGLIAQARYLLLDFDGPVCDIFAGLPAAAIAGRLTDWVSLGVLAAFVPRDAVDDAVAAAGKQARRSDGKLPPHVMVYFAMAMALFADDD